MVHLNFDRFREHSVEFAGSRCIHEDSAVSGLLGEAVFKLKTEVFVNFVSDEVTAGLSEAYQHSVACHEARLDGRILVSGRNIAVPAGEILAVEKLNGRCLISQKEIWSEESGTSEKQSCRFHSRYD